MRRFYQFAIVIASTALGWIIAMCIARSPLNGQLATLLAGNKGDLSSMVNLLIYAGMVAGVLITLGTLGGLFAGVVLARRVGKHTSPLELTGA